MLLADGLSGPFRFEIQYLKAILTMPEQDFVALPHTQREKPQLPSAYDDNDANFPDDPAEAAGSPQDDKASDSDSGSSEDEEGRGGRDGQRRAWSARKPAVPTETEASAFEQDLNEDEIALEKLRQAEEQERERRRR